MRFDVFLTISGASLATGILLARLAFGPRMRRLAQNLRVRDWTLTHLRAEHAEQQRLFDVLVEHGPLVVIRLDAAGRPVYASPSCQRVLGYAPTDMPHQPGLDLTQPGPDSCYPVRHKDGRMLAMRAQCRPLPDGQGAVLILTDVTAHRNAEAQLAEASAQLKRRTSRDLLTGLANREYFLEMLGAALSDRAEVAVLLLDLDRFRSVNDRYGHDTGDRLLREIAARLTLAMVGGAVVARLGDDDFAVFMSAAEGDAPLAARARDLIRVLDVPVPADTINVHIGASIGIAVGPRDGDSPGTLLRAADIAMTQARASGGNTYRFYEARMAAVLARADSLRRELPAAIASGQIVPYFQPLVRMDDVVIVGFEVLARWLHPVLGLLPPAEFLPLVEEIGQSAAMFRSVLTHACRTALRWPSDIVLSVNISPHELQDDELPDTMRDILALAGLGGDRLEIEITENALVHDARTARMVLDRLRGMGMTVALDDFGTGYSSLYHLRELPFDKVKIDKAFMKNLDTDPAASRYVAAIIDFVHTLGLDITAEGIEDSAVLTRLRELGCTFGQGYLFGRPMPAEDATRMLTETRQTELAAD